MAQTNVNFKMDKKLKEDLKEFCEGAGMTMSILFNIVAKNIVANHQIPFIITYNDPIYSAKNVAEIKEISHEMDEGNYVELDLNEV